jgi:hypothetical protein
VTGLRIVGYWAVLTLVVVLIAGPAVARQTEGDESGEVAEQTAMEQIEDVAPADAPPVEQEVLPEDAVPEPPTIILPPIIPPTETLATPTPTRSGETGVPTPQAAEPTLTPEPAVAPPAPTPTATPSAQPTGTPLPTVTATAGAAGAGSPPVSCPSTSMVSVARSDYIAGDTITWRAQGFTPGTFVTYSLLPHPWRGERATAGIPSTVNTATVNEQCIAGTRYTDELRIPYDLKTGGLGAGRYVLVVTGAKYGDRSEISVASQEFMVVGGQTTNPAFRPTPCFSVPNSWPPC